VVLLNIAPVVLTSVLYGAAAGVATATLAVTFVVIGAWVVGVNTGAAGMGTLAFAFYAIPLTIWLARLEATEAAPSATEGSSAAQPSAEPSPAPLTRREREVLGLLAAGHTNAEMAEELFLSVRTIESHRASLRRKLGRHDREELVRLAMRSGLLVTGDTGTTSTDVVLKPNHRS
jgi:DNA-binding CsgD family transcriptional regulator